jgi:hypothetical protein
LAPRSRSLSSTSSAIAFTCGSEAPEQMRK